MIGDIMLHNKVTRDVNNTIRSLNKIVYIGGTGKIGTKALPFLINGLDANSTTQIFLMCSGHSGSKERLTGQKMDLLEYAASLNKTKISIKVTDSYADTKDADITLCSAGLWPSNKDREESLKIDPSGRNVQTIMNKQMIKEIVKNVSQYSPNNLFIMATNQVDTLCEIARKEVPKSMTILGLSGYVDSSRLKRIAFEETGKHIDGLMIGYHNPSMIPLKSSFRGDLLTEKELENIIAKTKTRGKLVSDLQKVGLPKNIDTGASVLPAAALSRAALAYLGSINPFVQSWNTLIKDQKIADNYGMKVGESLSIPLLIEKSTVSYKGCYQTTQEEKEHLRKARKDLLAVVKQVGN